MSPVRSITLEVLSKAHSTGKRHHAWLLLRRYDPLLAWWCRRRLFAALRYAELGTSVQTPQHQIRVAALHVSGRIPDTGYEDEAAVLLTFQELMAERQPARRGPWLVASLAVSLMLLTLGLSAASFFGRPFGARDIGVGAILGPELTQYVTLGAPAEASGMLARRLLMVEKTRRVLDDRAAGLLDRMLLSFTRLQGGDEDSKDELDELVRTAVDFNELLAQRNSPYFVDVDALFRGRDITPQLFTFYIEREREIEIDGQRTRSVHVWRLDELGNRQGYIGYTRPHTPAALVLLDQVEADLIGDVLPALPAGERMELVEATIRADAGAWVHRLEKMAARVLRRHFSLLDSVNGVKVREVAALLAERRRLIHEWQYTLAAQGARLRVPRRLIPEGDYLGALELRITRRQLRRWEALHEELLKPGNLAAFLELRDNYVQGVERHEIQHRLDYRQGLFEVPEPLARRLGLANRLDAPPHSLAGRARDEMSAFLAAIAQAEPTPLLELTLLARYLFNSADAGTAYFFAALGVFEALASELQLPLPALETPVLRRMHLADLVTQVLDATPDELRNAARTAYERQFGMPLLEPALVSERNYQRWRH